jgi:hypothetical protein
MMISQPSRHLEISRNGLSRRVRDRISAIKRVIWTTSQLWIADGWGSGHQAPPSLVHFHTLHIFFKVEMEKSESESTESSISRHHPVLIFYSFHELTLCRTQGADRRKFCSRFSSPLLLKGHHGTSLAGDIGNLDSHLNSMAVCCSIGSTRCLHIVGTSQHRIAEYRRCRWDSLVLWRHHQDSGNSKALRKGQGPERSVLAETCHLCRHGRSRSLSVSERMSSVPDKILGLCGGLYVGGN